METRDTIEAYFRALSEGGSWQTFLADGLAFVSHVVPGKEVVGRDAYIESTRGFFSMITSLEVQQLIVEGDRACALTRYVLTPPAGEPFNCDVAEIFSVGDDSIESLEIYFDSAPFAALARRSG